MLRRLDDLGTLVGLIALSKSDVRRTFSLYIILRLTLKSMGNPPNNMVMIFGSDDKCQLDLASQLHWVQTLNVPLW